MGVTQGLACPCIFYHAARQLYSTVHGDDFTSTGTAKNLDWFEDTLQTYYELTKGGRLGPGKEDSKRGIILNRVIRWTDEGVEYEADPRSAERLLEATGMEGANGVGTPGVKVLAAQHEEDEELPKSATTDYRAKAARAN